MGVLQVKNVPDDFREAVKVRVVREHTTEKELVVRVLKAYLKTPIPKRPPPGK